LELRKRMAVVKRTEDPEQCRKRRKKDEQKVRLRKVTRRSEIQQTHGSDLRSSYKGTADHPKQSRKSWGNAHPPRYILGGLGKGGEGHRGVKRHEGETNCSWKSSEKGQNRNKGPCAEIDKKQSRV